MKADANPELPPPAETDLDVDLLAYLQTLSPLQRIARHDGALELVRALRAASLRVHGIDARAAAAAGLAPR
jgi:hypothetical protein